jgi:hypothetical protein
MSFAELLVDNAVAVPPRYPTKLPSETFRSARSMARAWAESLDDRRRMAMVRSFVGLAISAYAERLRIPVRTPPPDFTSAVLDFRASNLAATIGIGAGNSIR